MAKLTLGPLLFNWPVEAQRDFYFRIADEAPVDVVYLGEVVCSKRAAAFAPHIPEVVERLTQAGKAVVHSTLALVMTARECAAIRDAAADPELRLEANDISAAALLAGRPHVIGPFVNVYNEGTLRYLADNGATRIALPNELSAAAIGALAGAADGVEIEVQVFGRLPLAISARCYHARAHGLHKDGCQYVCEEDRDGMAVETLDGDPFLAVNGTQTLSHAYCSLIHELAPLVEMGVDCFRLWPHSLDMVAVARIFRAVLDGREDADAAAANLSRLAPGVTLANGFYHGREGAAAIAAQG